MLIRLNCYLELKNENISPRKKIINPGSDLRISCRNTLQWEFNLGFIKEYAEKINRNVIEISSASLNNSGTYSCFGTYRSRFKVEGFIARSVIHVYGEGRKLFCCYNKHM